MPDLKKQEEKTTETKQEIKTAIHTEVSGSSAPVILTAPVGFQLSYDQNNMPYTNENIIQGIVNHANYSAGSNVPGIPGVPGGAGGPSTSISSAWWTCVQKMGAWYQNNIHTYQGTTTAWERLKGKVFYHCPLIGTSVADDCSGFVKACLQAFGVKGIDNIFVSTKSMQPGGEFDRVIRAAGFTYMPYSSSIVSPGDIICGGASTHTEIFAGGGKSYSWGNIHDGISTRKQRRPQGMPSGFNTMNYKHIWRHS